MKNRIVALLLSLLTTLSGYGQKKMEFLGISLEDDLPCKLFNKKLKAKGFKQIDPTKLIGKFEGREVSVILLDFPPDGDLIRFCVKQSFPKNTELDTIKSEYNRFKKLYTDQYGTPLWLKVSMYDGSLWPTIFNADNGHIMIVIDTRDSALVIVYDHGYIDIPLRDDEIEYNREDFEGNSMKQDVVNEKNEEKENDTRP